MAKGGTTVATAYCLQCEILKSICMFFKSKPVIFTIVSFSCVDSWAPSTTHFGDSATCHLNGFPLAVKGVSQKATGGSPSFSQIIISCG